MKEGGESEIPEIVVWFSETKRRKWLTRKRPD